MAEAPPDWEQAPAVGKPLTVTDYTVDRDLIADYMARTTDAHPWYVDDSPFGGPVAPATLLFAHAHLRLDDWYLPNRYGNLHSKQEWAFFQPARLGDRIRATRTIVDRYRKRDRAIVVNEVTITRNDGALLARSRSHQSFLAETPDAGALVVDRDREKRADRRITPGAGARERFGPVTRLVDEALCDRFVGADRQTYHNDAEEARKLGFPGIVVQGTLPICFLNLLMTERFGAAWWTGGRMHLNLVNVLWAGETVHAHGAIREWTPEGGRTRADCEIWTAKDDGTITIIGSASAVAPPGSPGPGGR